jgi:nucleoside-diphosphate-sugar epimerase
MKANITGTANILEYAQTHGVKRMIFVSSSEVYGVNAAPDTATKNNLQECLGYIDLSDFRSAYPESKRAAEVLCTAYTHQYGISTVCARPWYIYGATFSEASSKADAQFLRKALAGEEIVMKSQGTQMRSYCYVSDCVTAMLKILLYGDNSAYDIAGKDDKTIREFAETIAETANVSIVYEEPDKTEHGGYTKILNSVCGKQRAQRTKELGYIPRYSVKDGIERTLKILRESM